MNTKITFKEAVLLYLKMNSDCSSGSVYYRYKGLGDRRKYSNKITYNLSINSRITRIIINYIVILLMLIASIILLFYNQAAAVLLLTIMLFPLMRLCLFLNFSIIKVLIMKKNYNDDNNAFKKLLKEYFLINSFNNVLGINKEKLGISIMESSNYLMIKNKIKVYKGNDYLFEILIERNKLIISENDNIVKIINDQSLDLVELKRMIIDHIMLTLDSIPHNYRWIYIANVNIKKRFIAYNHSVKFKRLVRYDKKIQINDKSIPEVKSAYKYRYYYKNKMYYILLGKVNECEYALFERIGI